MVEAIAYAVKGIADATSAVTNLISTKIKSKAQVQVAQLQLEMVKEQTVQLGVQKEMMGVQTIQQKNIIIGVAVIIFMLGAFYISSLKIKQG